MRRVLAGLTALALATGVWADQIATATLRAEFQIGTPATWSTARAGEGYSNKTTFSGQAFANGGADPNAAAPITKLVADDINNVLPGEKLTEFTFSVANLNTVAVSARARIRLYADNAGTPGTYITGWSFNPITFNAGSVGLWYTTLDPNTMPAMPAKFWAGMTFDNASGSTATGVQLNSLGQGIYDPPTVGSSADQFFVTTAPGSFLVSNPAGSLSNFGGAPVGNFGWEFKLTPEPASFVLAGLALLLIRRR